MKAPNKPRILAPAGTHVARLISIIYEGTLESQFGEAYKVNLSWELPTELHVFKEGEEPKPFVVSSEYTLSMHKKSTLRPIVEGNLGVALTDAEASAFDVDEILGKECLLSVIHEEKESGKYLKIKATAKLPKGMTCPPAVNDLKILSYDKWDQDYFDKLPKFIQEKMKKTPEYKKLKAIQSGQEENIDPNEIPF